MSSSYTALSLLQTLVAQLPSKQACYQLRIPSTNSSLNKYCIFGDIKTPHREHLKAIPLNACHFAFLCVGDETIEVLRAFIESDFPQQTQSLMIGSSSDDQTQAGKLNYQATIKLLGQCDWPKLQNLFLGEYILFCNGSDQLGRLGDITPLISRAPQLRELSLKGHFQLTSPVQLPFLRTLDIDTLSNMGLGPEPLSQSTVTHLGHSDWPQLKTAYLNLEDENEGMIYTIPTKLLNAQNTPQLTYFELCGQFIPGTRMAIQQSKLVHCPEIKLFLDDLIEPNA